MDANYWYTIERIKLIFFHDKRTYTTVDVRYWNNTPLSYYDNNLICSGIFCCF